ncbi:unnamed protein product [Rotaria sp. Silwood1]|nr:unnamed protein product [Rotaria sp. Silwood1]
MLPASQPATSEDTVDDCTICLNVLAQGTPLLTLSCCHKFHFQCLASNIQAKNKECPLCRATIEDSVVQLLTGPTQPPVQPQQTTPIPPPVVVPSVEDLIDEVTVRELSDRLASARQAAIASMNDTGNIPLIIVSTTVEYGAQVSHEESNIYGLVTLQAPTIILPAETASLVSSRVPIDLVCVVDQKYGAQVSHEESNIYGLVTLQAPTIILPAETAALVSSRVPIDLVCVVDQSGSMAGNVTVIYVDPNTHRTITTDPVSFKLVRGSQPPIDLLCVNHELDIQRNRVETAHALAQAMAENDYRQSRAILEAQVNKIKASASGQDPFCQKLIKDLEYSYPSERVYRSSHQNTYRCHVTERGTYQPSSNISSRDYANACQRRMALNFPNNKSS